MPGARMEKVKKNNSDNLVIRLKEIRNKLSLTQEKMAVQMGVSYSSYIKYERGMRFPSLPGLRKLALESDVSMDWLIFGKGPMFYSGKRLNAELDQLQEQLEQTRLYIETLKAEHQNELENQAQQMALEPELQELIDGMKQDDVLYHEILATFSRLKREEQAG